MNQRKQQREYTKELLKGGLAFASSYLVVAEVYPLLPAYFAVCSMNGQASLFVIIGALLGMYYFMTLEVAVKYVFVLLVIGLGVKLYRWSNRYCTNGVVALLAATAAMIMNLAGNAFYIHHVDVWLDGAYEGALVFAAVAGICYIKRIPFFINYFLELGHDRASRSFGGVNETQTQRMESFAYAVNGLSDAFFLLSQPKEKLPMEDVSVLEQELTGKLCASCDGCAICWNENRMKRQGGIRALLHAVVNHSTKEELLKDPYVNECYQYEAMVEEALQAFGRLELNYAWYNRLCENRYVIAQQLDAMAGLMEEWVKTKTNMDKLHKNQMAEIAYEVKEKGMCIEDLHIYEENKRLCIEGYVYTKWDGGIPIKQYINVLEQVVKKPLRLGKEHKSVLSQEPVFVSVYEDTMFYGLQGIATEKKNGSLISGDSYSFFAMDDGNYHVCLSDGMGSGSKANKESEMVVDLLQKFIEAGFRKEIAIKLMNSAMVLQGEENVYSTLDYAMIDLYTGKLELIKIGGAATFIKHGDEVECIDHATLPAGADVRMEVESTKKQLSSGDFLVMVTDGVIEYLNVRNPKETMQNIIASAKTENAGALAEMILNQVKMYTGGYALDDMTVLVTGIWEK